MGRLEQKLRFMKIMMTMVMTTMMMTVIMQESIPVVRKLLVQDLLLEILKLFLGQVKMGDRFAQFNMCLVTWNSVSGTRSRVSYFWSLIHKLPSKP